MPGANRRAAQVSLLVADRRSWHFHTICVSLGVLLLKRGGIRRSHAVLREQEVTAPSINKSWFIVNGATCFLLFEHCIIRELF